MKPRRFLTALLVGTLALCATLFAQQTPPAGAPGAAARRAGAWYKGNIHTHTIATDGDSAPDQVVRWYREQKYNFLVLSDHNTVVNVDGLNALYATSELVGADRRVDVPFNPFMLIRGEEVSDKFSPEAATPGERDLQSKEIHLGALNVPMAVAPQGGTSVADTIQRDVDAIRAAGGVPVVNHPNFLWAITADDMKGLKNVGLFELFNGHMQTHNLGGGGRPSVEAIWDEVLSAGTLLFGIAADDAHAFQKLGLPNPMSAPGRGWIMVRAQAFTASAILAAMERGDFYATTGVELSDVRRDGQTVSVTVKPFSRSKYQVQFIGKGGRVLKDVPVDPVITARTGPLAPTVQPVTYDITGDEGYVRVKVVESNGQVAWTQPVLVPAK
jgi:hypothetical protein